MEELKIKASSWKIYLAVAGILVFVIVGLVLVIANTSFLEKFAGVLAIVFFGGFGGFALYSTLRKGQGNVIVSPKTLTLNFPALPPIHIPWQDIEDFGTYKISGQDFTTVTLNSYQHVLNSLDYRETQKILHIHKSLKIIGYFSAALGTMNLENPSETLNILPESSDLKDLASLLYFQRNTFGGEFQLGWNMRDRKADQFAEFLREKHREFLPKLKQH